MGSLRTRLARIREVSGSLGGGKGRFRGAPGSGEGPAPAAASSGVNPVFPEGWTSAGYKVLRRRLALPLSAPLVLPGGLSFLLPDIARIGSENNGAYPGPEKLLFFDLETTGLSCGAGTVAFLAACGRFVSPRAGEFTELEITQFLLLDYPGEPDFLDAVLGELSSCVLATYNGKSFDSQILTVRCLMNGITPPVLPQLDLLHPSRRLWKHILPACSQAHVETMILGLDRAGDLPGAMAPEIWFDFLRSGGDFAPRENAGKSGTPDGKADRAGQRALLGICDHNLRDIFGLASLFCAFAAIAASPLEAPARFRCDAWQLALCWRGRASKRPARHTGSGTSGTENAGREKTAALLLERAAGTCPRACFRLALDLRACLRREEARARLLELRAWPGLPENGRQGCPPRVKALALRALSIDAEKNLGLDQALAYTAEALALFSPDHGESGFPRAPALPARLKEDLEKRKKRLLNRLETPGVSEPVSKLQF